MHVSETIAWNVGEFALHLCKRGCVSNDELQYSGQGCWLLQLTLEKHSQTSKMETQRCCAKRQVLYETTRDGRVCLPGGVIQFDGEAFEPRLICESCAREKKHSRFMDVSCSFCKRSFQNIFLDTNQGDGCDVSFGYDGLEGDCGSDKFDMCTARWSSDKVWESIKAEMGCESGNICDECVLVLAKRGCLGELGGDLYGMSVEKWLKVEQMTSN